jgi:hypothetical protein
VRPLGQKVTTYVRVYPRTTTKFLLLATFCSRILLIWQSTSVIFRNSQLFFGVRETCRSQLSHFENPEYRMQPRPSGSGGSRPSRGFVHALTRTRAVFARFARRRPTMCNYRVVNVWQSVIFNLQSCIRS